MDWYHTHQTRQQERARERRQRDPERIRAVDRVRYLSDREKRLEIVYARIDRIRAEKYGVEFDSSVTRPALRDALGDRCHYCGIEMDFAVGQPGPPAPRKATIEHQVPISRGGPHTWANCVLACWSCNEEKKLMTADEWTAEVVRAEGRDEAQDLHPASGSARTALASH